MMVMNNDSWMRSGVVCASLWLAACGAVEAPDTTSQRPPPQLVLEVPDSLTPGQAGTFRVVGPPAMADELPTFFVFGGQGIGAGICPGPLNGDCLDVAGQPARVERTETELGEALVTLQLPASLQIPTLTVQAVVLGPSGARVTSAVEIPVTSAPAGSGTPCGTAMSPLEEPETYDYIGDGAEAHLLDVYRVPGTQDQRPTLFWIHGGGWQEGDKLEAEDGPAYQLASGLGYTLISINYSYATEVPYTQILGETKRALAWVKDNAASIGVDPERIVAAGDSAGGHLASFLATSSGAYDLGVQSDTRVAAGVSYYGVYDLAMEDYQDACGMELELLYEFLDCDGSLGMPSQACDADDLAAASPSTYVDPNDPPMLLAHGQQDCVVPWEQAQRMGDVLQDAGVPHVLSLSPQGEHDPGTLDITSRDIAAWIADTVGCPTP
jgi:acetyl esterase/lipase